MKRIIYYLLFSFGLLLFTACASAIKERAPFSFGPDDPLPRSALLKEGTLDNGITYLIQSNSTPEKRATLVLIVNSGSAVETENNFGVAHLIEHMAFNGTEHFPGKGIDDFMADIGMGTCECYDAYTGLEETVYRFVIPTDEPDTIEKGLLVLSDIAGRISFDPGEFEKERGVIIEEWREKQGVPRRNSRKKDSVFYKGTPYAERLSSEDKPFTDGVGLSEVLDFYREWYQPDQMAVIAVGDFDRDAVETLIRKKFSYLKNSGVALKKVPIRIPDREETDFIIVSDPEQTFFGISINHLHDISWEGTISDYKKLIKTSFAIGLLNERLSVKLSEKDPPYIGASLSENSISRVHETYGLSFIAQEGSVGTAMKATFDEVGRVLRDGFTQSELDRVISLSLLQLEDYEKKSENAKTSKIVSELKRHYLTGEPVVDNEWETEATRKILNSLSLDDINSTANDIFSEKNRLIVVYSPEGKEHQLPGREEILASLRDMGKTDVEQYVDKIVNDELMLPLQGQGSVLSEVIIEKFGAVELTLSNGAVVVLKPVDIDKDEMLFKTYRLGGHSLASDENYLSALLSPVIVLGGGIGSYDARSLEHYLNNKRVAIMPYINELDEGLVGGGSTQEVEALLKLIYLYFTSPKKDETVFNNYKVNLLLSLDALNKQEGKVYLDALSETLYQNHPRRSPVTEEMVSRLDLDRSVTFYRDRFSDASGFKFFFVGDFAVDEIKPLVVDYIGSLPSKFEEETWKDVGIMIPRGVIEKVVRSGNEQKATVSLMFGGPYSWSQKNNLELSILTYILEQMLRESLREDLSGTYGVNVSNSIERFPRPAYMVTISFNCSPERVEPLVNEVFSLIEKVKNPSDLTSYFDTKVKKMRRAQETSKRDNEYWLDVISSTYFYEIPPADYMSSIELLDDVNVDNIGEAASTLFDFRNYIKIIYYSGT